MAPPFFWGVGIPGVCGVSEQELQISVELVGDGSESLPRSSNLMARVSGLEFGELESCNLQNSTFP